MNVILHYSLAAEKVAQLSLLDRWHSSTLSPNVKSLLQTTVQSWRERLQRMGKTQKVMKKNTKVRFAIKTNDLKETNDHDVKIDPRCKVLTST